MGVWGRGSFESDTALDWLGKVWEGRDFSLVRTALSGDLEMAEITVARGAIAAADLVACRDGVIDTEWLESISDLERRLQLDPCSKERTELVRMHKYSEEKHVVYTTDFPIRLDIEIQMPGVRATIENWLLDHGFKKALDADSDKRQQYIFGDTFNVYLWSFERNVQLTGYGIRTADQNVEPVLRELIEFIDAHYEGSFTRLVVCEMLPRTTQVPRK